MKRLFIHNPLFRILSPFATGVLVYLLILLVNNNVEQINEEFLGQELYICIGLAFLIQEFARLSIVVIKIFRKSETLVWMTVVQFCISLALTILLVNVVMRLYFSIYLGYTPNAGELAIFYVLFSFITLIYLLLYTGHQFLYAINTERLQREKRASMAVDDEFSRFSEEINSELLFSCLESMLLLMKRDPDQAEELADKFASLYRYILEKRADELVAFDTEMAMIKVQREVYNELPYRSLEIEIVSNTDALVVPLSILKIMERIIKHSIPSETSQIKVVLNADDEKVIRISYRPEDRLGICFTNETIKDIAFQYSVYTDLKIEIENTNNLRSIIIPKLQMI